MAHPRVLEWYRQYSPNIGNPFVEDIEDPLVDEEEAMASYYRE